MVQSIILTGATAVGKSQLALQVAKICNLEIINADSIAFYQEFDIGSAKPTLKERQEVPHHLIDVARPDAIYHAGDFLRDIEQVISDIHARGKRALIVGGSGFYLKALRYGLWPAPPTSRSFRESIEEKSMEALVAELKEKDPVHLQKIGSKDRYRIVRALEIITLSGEKPSELQAKMKTEPDPKYSLWVINREANQLVKRMRFRIEEMIEAGWIEEVKALRATYPNSKSLGAVGYAQILRYLDGIAPQGRKLLPGLPGLISEIELSHRQLAKTQRTWHQNLKPDESFLLDEDRSIAIEKILSFYH